VVVAVDARWLVTALETHHHELFGSGGATAIDYLDKIFQIPFTLLPPSAEATAGYLRSLLPVPPREGAEARVPPGVRVTPGVLVAAETVKVLWGTDEMAPPEATGSTGDRGPTVDLRPRGLQVSVAEIEFLARLGGLLPTPRAAKRLVSIYRLVRIGVPDAGLASFLGDENGGPYQTVQLMLAVLAGHPEWAREIFVVLLGDAGGGTGAGGDLASVAAGMVPTGSQPHPFGMIHDFLIRLRAEAPAALSLTEARRWCPRLARFSFYTRELAGRDLDVAAVAGLADVDAGRDPLAQLGHVADDADDAAAGPEAVQDGHDLVQGVLVQGAETLVDEQG
jgi:hypothetical protein